MQEHTRSKQDCKIRINILDGCEGWAHLLNLLWCLLALLIGSIVILAWVPPVSRDALVHHLAIPKLYLTHGGIYEIPSMVFSYYPMNLELLYMVPLWLGNDIVPKFIHLSFGLFTAWLIYAYIRERIGASYAILGVLLFLSIPIIVKLSVTVYVDLGLVFFSTASLILLMRWRQDSFRLKHLIFSAICCGLAMGTKYNGLITFLLIGLFVPFLYAKYGPANRTSFFRSSAYGLIFVSVALLIFSPWMIRNYLWTQNPIYPLYDQWINAQRTPSQTVGVLAYRSLFYNESWWEIALLPIRIFFQGQDNNPQYFDGHLTSFLFVFPIFSLFSLKSDSTNVRNEKIILIAFTILYFFIVLFTSTLRIRYIASIIPPLLILSVYGLKDILSFVLKISNNSK
ncbi:glycosyltransferase family 39 protein, partial [bacterium]|nr:glycosyltransferase family 39 protein [bacterium]